MRRGLAQITAMLLAAGCGAADGGRGASEGSTGDAGSSGAGSSGAASEPTSTSTTSATSTTTESPTSTSTTAEPTTDASTSGSGGASSSASTGGGVVALKIEPPGATVVVASGWSFPVDFAVSGIDGGGQPVAVAASWALDEPALGEVTKFGGTFQARNTAAGVVTLTASAAGLNASAKVSVEVLDDLPTCPPRPPLTVGEPGPGTFVKVVAPEYEGTAVYHGLYLPPDWQPGQRYPVIVESPCNKYGSFTGKVDDTQLGYHLAGCRSYIWLVVPYIQGQANLDYGWGDVPATLAYWRAAVARTLATYGGDAGAVTVTGFSRGAIGASFVGLSDDEVADTWLSFFMHSHADVVSTLTPDQGAGSSVRMGRVRGRASLLSWGAVDDGGSVNSLKGVDLLESFGYPVTTLAVPGVGHTDAWIAADATSRQFAQTWLFQTVAARPGTRAIRGRVVDEDGVGVADAAMSSGARTTWTDAHGYYALRGLVPGLRQVACAHPSLTCSSAQMVDVAEVDAEDVDFTASP